ncbi:16682_t:CDS:1, partial [Funneliformis caledonium]
MASTLRKRAKRKDTSHLFKNNSAFDNSNTIIMLTEQESQWILESSFKLKLM